MLSQIKAIETKCEFSVNVLDGLRFLQQAWECVSPVTIANCFRHAGFSIYPVPSPDNGDEAEVEIYNIPLDRLASLGDKVALSDFVQFFETLPTSSSDEDIISDVLEARENGEDQDDAESIASEPIIKPTNVDDALSALETMRDFF